MMWIAECNIDKRGRLTLPKSFMKANGLTEHTRVFVQTIFNTPDTIKLVFENTIDTMQADEKAVFEDEHKYRPGK